MPILTTVDLQKRYPVGTGGKMPVVTQDEIAALKKTYGGAEMRTMYGYVEHYGGDINLVASKLNMPVERVMGMYEGHKKVQGIGYRQQGVIWVPPWNDLIHLVDEKTLDEDTQKARMIDRIKRLKQSPTPAVVKNIGTILTAIDDVQDFCTTVGVGARLISKMVKPAHILAKGSFTLGARLNQINLWNKIPWERLSGDELLAMVRTKKIDLDTLSLSQLKSLKTELAKNFPGWEKLSEKQRQAFMRQNYKTTRERWGLSLKVKKKQAEELYGKGTPWGKVKTEVDRRLLRTLPTQGEAMEIAQTSDMMAGVGLSLGAAVGLATDVVFGLWEGAPLKFSKQTISTEEIKVLKDIGSTIINLPHETRDAFQQAGNAMLNISFMIATGEDLGVQDTMLAAWAQGQAYLSTRKKETRDALLNILDHTKNWLWTMGPRTPALVREALILEGIDPFRKEGFPGVKLGSEATTDEIVHAYTEKCQEVLKHYQAELTTQVKGEFLQGCLECLATNTAGFAVKEGGVITETFTPELMIYTRACDWGLEPPVYATDEQFQAWHSYVMDQMKVRNLETPSWHILVAAKPLFWPPGQIMDLDPELLIFTKACEWGYGPTAEATEKGVQEWLAWVLWAMKLQMLDSPNKATLKSAYALFFGPKRY